MEVWCEDQLSDDILDFSSFMERAKLTVEMVKKECLHSMKDDEGKHKGGLRMHDTMDIFEVTDRSFENNCAYLLTVTTVFSSLMD